MKTEWWIHFRSVAWKELIESWRRSRILAPLSILSVLILQYIPMAQISNTAAIQELQKQAMFASLTLYLPLMIIPSLGSTLLSWSLYSERLNKSIHVLFAHGVSPTSIWSAKYVVASCFSVLCSVIAIALYSIMVFLISGVSPHYSAALLTLSFITIPIAALGLLALVGWLYWVVKNPQIIGILVPIVSVLGTWNMALKLGSNYPIQLITIVSFIVGIVFIAIVMTVISRLPKEAIVDL